MYRSTKEKSPTNSFTCSECNGTRGLFQGGTLTCTNCGTVVEGEKPRKRKSSGVPYGSKKTVDKNHKRVCQHCGGDYYKDTRIGLPLWKTTKFCTPKCQVAAKKIYEHTSERHEAYRRRKGVLKLGSPELSEKLSLLTKLAMQTPEVQEKIRKPRSALSLERRMQISNNLAGKMPANMSNINQYSNIQRGYYDINETTMYFRSKWEANYALYLDFLTDHKEVVKWEFEPDTFMFEKIKLGTRSYTPDFKVFMPDGSYEYHEVKGYMDSKSKTKLKRFKKYYPDEKLVLIDSDTYKLLVKQIGKVCKFY